MRRGVGGITEVMVMLFTRDISGRPGLDSTSNVDGVENPRKRR